MTPETQEDSEEIRLRYEQYIIGGGLDGVYRNYGDATPEGHGGIWIAYFVDRQRWDVWITIPAEDAGLSDFESPGSQIVEAAEIRWKDVVDDGGSWSDTFTHVSSTYHRGHPEPIGAVVDRRLTGYVAHEARNWSDPYPYRQQPVVEDSYDEILDRFGIEPREE